LTVELIAGIFIFALTLHWYRLFFCYLSSIRNWNKLNKLLLL
jgi:hypothetical protein